MLCAAKHFTPASLGDKINRFDAVLKQILQNGSIEFKSLVAMITSKTPLQKPEVISLLKHKIYYGNLMINWNEPWDHTLISLEGDPPGSVYDMEENINAPAFSTDEAEQADDPSHKITIRNERDATTYSARLRINQSPD